MSLLRKAVSVACLLALNACGGGGGGAGGTPDPNTFSGVALDGYLYQAQVCLDLNDNFLCDTGEPTASTDLLGRFTLANVTQAQVAAHSILVNAIAGKTIDMDNPTDYVKQNYLLTAPAGGTVISPLTTLIKAEMVTKGVEADAAAASVYNTLFANANSGWAAALNLRSFYVDYHGSNNAALQKIAAAIINDRISSTGVDTNNPELYWRQYFRDFTQSVAELVTPNVDALGNSASVKDALALVSVFIASGYTITVTVEGLPRGKYLLLENRITADGTNFKTAGLMFAESATRAFPLPLRPEVFYELEINAAETWEGCRMPMFTGDTQSGMITSNLNVTIICH